MNLRVRLEVSFPDLDCKTVGFFLKISKEIGKAWRTESYAREMRESLSLALCFHPRSRLSKPFVWLLARTRIHKNTDCFAVYWLWDLNLLNHILFLPMNCAASFYALASLAFVQETRTGFRAEGDLVPPFFHTFFIWHRMISCFLKHLTRKIKLKHVIQRFDVSNIFTVKPRSTDTCLHLIITGNFLYPWGKKALTFSLNSSRLTRTSLQYGHLLEVWIN